MRKFTMKKLLNYSLLFVIVISLTTCKKELIKFPTCLFSKEYFVSSSGIIKLNQLFSEQDSISISKDTLYVHIIGGFLLNSDEDCKNMQYIDDKILNIRVYCVSESKTINLDSVVFFKDISSQNYYSKQEFLENNPQRIRNLIIVLWNYNSFLNINKFKIKIIIDYLLENNEVKTSVLFSKEFSIYEQK